MLPEAIVVGDGIVSPMDSPAFSGSIPRSCDDGPEAIVDVFSAGIPHNYDVGLVPIIFADYAADLAALAAAAKPERVLEIAAGTGAVTRCLRDRLPVATHLTATDLRDEMLAIARTKFRPGEQVEFDAADASDLPYADESFDAVVCQFGVMVFSDKHRSYREVHRVLKTGGRYFLNIWESEARNPYARITNAIMADAFPEDPPQFMRLPYSYPVETCTDSLRAAGFAGITTSVVTKRKDVPDLVAFARGFLYGSPMVEQIRARAGVETQHLVDALVSNFRSEFGNPPQVTLEATVISASKS